MLLDFRASSNFINLVIVQQLGLLIKKKEVSKEVKGLDRELLSNIIIEEIGWVLITIEDYKEKINFNIIRLSNIDIVLGIL